MSRPVYPEDSTIEDNALEEATPFDATPEEVDRGNAGLKTDPADWMTENLAGDDEETDEADQMRLSEATVMDDSAGEGFSQSALSMIVSDHQRITEMFDRYLSGGDTPSADAEMLVEQILVELEIHAQIEEELFYPALQAAADDDTRDFIENSLDEHSVVEGMISDLRAMEPGSPEQDAELRSLIEQVTAHIEEEETMLLPYAEETLGNELIDLGQAMYERKQEAMGSENILPSDTGRLNSSV